jgi:hypothetical protein
MKETEWSKDGKIADNTINTVLKALKESNMIEDKNYSKADFLV